MANKTVYVGGFGADVDQEKLFEVFSTFGDIVDVQLPPDPSKRFDDATNHRGFGYIEFQQPSDALDAIDNMHENEINGRQIKCNLARAKPSAAGTNNFKPIWEDKSFLEQFEQENEKTVA